MKELCGAKLKSMLWENLDFGPESSALQMISMFTLGAWQPARPELFSATFFTRVRVRVRPSSRGEPAEDGDCRDFLPSTLVVLALCPGVYG